MTRDKEVCSYFNKLMTRIEFDMVLAKEEVVVVVQMNMEVVVVVQMNVEYEGEESALDEEWQLLFDLNDWVAELERAIQVWMGQQ